MHRAFFCARPPFLLFSPHCTFFRVWRPPPDGLPSPVVPGTVRRDWKQALGAPFCAPSVPRASERVHCCLLRLANLPPCTFAFDHALHAPHTGTCATTKRPVSSLAVARPPLRAFALASLSPSSLLRIVSITNTICDFRGRLETFLFKKTHTPVSLLSLRCPLFSVFGFCASFRLSLNNYHRSSLYFFKNIFFDAI